MAVAICPYAFTEQGVAGIAYEQQMFTISNKVAAKQVGALTPLTCHPQCGRFLSASLRPSGGEIKCWNGFVSSLCMFSCMKVECRSAGTPSNV